MASLKAEKPAGSQLFGPVKKEPAKAGDGPAKAPTSKSGPKKPAQKSQEPKKKVNMSYPHMACSRFLTKFDLILLIHILKGLSFSVHIAKSIHRYGNFQIDMGYDLNVPYK